MSAKPVTTSLTVGQSKQSTFAPSTKHVTASTDPPLPDIFYVPGPVGPPIPIQQEIDNLYNPLADSVFSYGATLPLCYAASLPRSLKEAQNFPFNGK